MLYLINLFNYEYEPDIRLALLCFKAVQYYERSLNYESTFRFILGGVDEPVTKYGINNTIFVGMECCKDKWACGGRVL